MLHGCLVETEQHNRSIALCQTCFADISAGRLPVLLQRQPVDGMIVRGWMLPELTRVLEQLRVPVVLMDCDRPASTWPHVRINNLQAMEDLVAYLVSRGAQEFATITGDLDHVNAQERLAGLQMALRRRGLGLPEANTIEERGFDEASGRRGAAKLLDAGRGFDTLVCQSDPIAAGAYDELIARGMRVPEQVRLTGFDNMAEFGDRYAVPFTTVDPQPFVIGQIGARLLGELLTDGKVRNVEVTVPCKLVVRQSA
jgi:LacI family transcriptional regulator